VNARSIADFERGAPSPIWSTLGALHKALEHVGVVMVEENNDGGSGVHLKA